MKARVLVTGALGNVGREVARACRASGLVVRGADVKSEGLSERCDEVAALDFLRPESWGAALADCQFVFLLRPPPLGDMSTTLNPFATEAFARGVRHLVFLSVSGAESKTWVPHRKVEDHLATLGDRWTVLRPGFFAQNLGDAYRQDVVLEHRLFVPAGDGRVAFLDVADVGDVVAKIFEAPESFRGKALRLAGPEALSFGEVAQRLSSVLGAPIRYQPASVPGYVWHLWRHRRLPLMQVVVQTVLHVGLRSGEAEAVDDTQLPLLGRPARAIDGYLARERGRWLTSPSGLPAESR